MSKQNFIPRDGLSGRLRQLFPNNNGKTEQKKKPPIRAMRPLHEIGEDGVDHINIWDHGKTELGKLLALSTPLNFRHSRFNRFNTIEGFWNYIRSVERDDRLRKFVGKPLRLCISNLTFRHVTNFKAIIMDANWQKIKQYPELAEAVKESTLPFDSYFIYRRQDGVPERPQFVYWLIEGFNEIRNALKEDREPNFEFLKSRKGTDIFVDFNKPKEDETQQKPKEDTGKPLSVAEESELAALLRSSVHLSNEEAPAQEDNSSESEVTQSPYVEETIVPVEEVQESVIIESSNVVQENTSVN